MPKRDPSQGAATAPARHGHPTTPARPGAPAALVSLATPPPAPRPQSPPTLERVLFVHPLRSWSALCGMALFWAADAFATWAGLAMFGFRMNAAALFVGFATGMVFTRRHGQQPAIVLAAPALSRRFEGRLGRHAMSQHLADRSTASLSGRLPADSACLTDPPLGRAAARRLSFRTSVRVMKTLAWASFLTFGIPAPGSTGSATVAVAWVAAGSAEGGTGGLVGVPAVGELRLEGRHRDHRRRVRPADRISLSPGIARQRASRTLPV